MRKGANLVTTQNYKKMTKGKNKVPDFEKLGQKLINEAMRYASVHALNFFKDSFQKGGFTDTSFQSWEKRKHDNRIGGALLVQSGNLRDSLQILSRSPSRLIFGSNEPHAKIHNQGGVIRIPVTKRSRRFFWFMYKSTGDAHWKWMALTKKSHMVAKIPKRQFIGHSVTLMNELNHWHVKKIESEFKKHINNL